MSDAGNSAVPSPLDAVFASLADPIRRGIINRLTRGACSVGELGAPFPVSAPAISKHLSVLERSGLIERWKSGRVHYCRITTGPLLQASRWIEQHQAFWEQQLDALEEYLDGETACARPLPGDPRLPSTSGGGSAPRRSGSSGRGRSRKR